MKTFLLEISLCLTIFIGSAAARGPEWRSAKEWRQLSYEAKIYYMNGVFDGISVAPSFAGSDKAAAQLDNAIVGLFKVMDADAAVRALDAFYQVSQNSRIPIGAAVFYMALARNPATRAGAPAALAELRRKSR